MKMVLDSVRHIEMPDSDDWAIYFSQWFEALVDALGAKHDRFDREDAVMQAFLKIMARGEEWTGAPDTEKELFGCLLWQAKGALSHNYEKKEIETRHATSAVADGFFNSGSGARCRIDHEIMKNAAFATLQELCELSGMKSKNIDAYRRCYLDCEPTEQVAKELGMTANNIHQIKSRIEKLLKTKGRDCYLKHRQRMFVDAA